ncbi:MAG: DUF3052 domain-containing protein [Deltaproteobacteria bacterium]|nr:DUF3052 domain-containing protein [Deltaproteobacteria bacterium]
MAGYSGTPLHQKLGLKPGTAYAVLGAPAGYLHKLDPPPGARALSGTKGANLVQLFVTREAELQKRLPALVKTLPADGALWVSWPKGKQKAAVPTDLDDDIVRARGLAAGLVDVKVCAVDEIWSGLKFVFRLADRPKKARAKK